MSREFNNPSPEEQPDDNFLEALSENLGQLDDTPVDEIFEDMDASELERVTQEVGELTNDDYKGWDENPTPTVNKEDVWDFQEKFDDPTREYNEDQRDMTLSFFNSAKEWGFGMNSDHVRPGTLGEPTVELTHRISDDSELRTHISETNPDDRTPIISITHWQSGVGKKSSTYIFDKDTGLVHRHDEAYDPKREELRSRFRNLFRDRENASQEEIENTASEILESFLNRSEAHEDETKLGVNGRPVGLSEVMRLGNIIRDSTPLK
jgi:hypothetical protein